MIRNDAPRRRLALAWYHEEEWQNLKAVSVDADKLEDTFDEWLKHARMAIRVAQEAGLEIVNVPVGIDELVMWCQENGLEVDGAARAQFTAKKASNLG
jgi:hypothetical protein